MAPNHLRGVAITGRMPQEYNSILTPECISFVAHLARLYTPRVNELLNRSEHTFSGTFRTFFLFAQKPSPALLTSSQCLSVVRGGTPLDGPLCSMAIGRLKRSYERLAHCWSLASAG